MWGLQQAVRTALGKETLPDPGFECYVSDICSCSLASRARTQCGSHATRRFRLSPIVIMLSFLCMTLPATAMQRAQSTSQSATSHASTPATDHYRKRAREAAHNTTPLDTVLVDPPGKLVFYADGGYDGQVASWCFAGGGGLIQYGRVPLHERLPQAELHVATPTAHVAELVAAYLLFQFLLENFERLFQGSTLLCVVLDNSNVVNLAQGIMSPSHDIQLTRKLQRSWDALQAKVRAELTWVPSHTGVLGNELVDAGASAGLTGNCRHEATLLRNFTVEQLLHASSSSTAIAKPEAGSPGHQAPPGPRAEQAAPEQSGTVELPYPAPWQVGPVQASELLPWLIQQLLRSANPILAAQVAGGLLMSPVNRDGGFLQATQRLLDWQRETATQQFEEETEQEEAARTGQDTGVAPRPESSERAGNLEGGEDPRNQATPPSSNLSPLRASVLLQEQMPLDLQALYVTLHTAGDPEVQTVVKDFLLDCRNLDWNGLRTTLEARQATRREPPNAATGWYYATQPQGPSALSGPVPPQSPLTLLQINPPLLLFHLHSVCNGIGTSTQALLRAFGKLEAQGIARCRVDKEDIYELDAISNRIAERLSQAQWSRRLQGDIMWLPHKVRQGAGDLIPLLLNGSPCEKLSKGTMWPSNADSGLVGPHAFPSNLRHVIHQAILELAKSAKPFISVSEMVVPAVKAFEQELELLWGLPRLVQCENWGGARRSRLFFTIPPAPPPEVDERTATGSLPGNWLWPLPQYTSLRVPHTIRAMLPELMRRLHQGGLDREEAANVLQLRTYNFELGTSFPSVRTVAVWLAWKEPQITQLLQLYPCQRPLDTLGQSSAESCGRTLYCSNCEEAIYRLGKTWHVGASSSLLSSVIKAFVQAREPFQVTLKAHPHVCRGSCDQAITRAQARALQNSSVNFARPPVCTFSVPRPNVNP